MICLILTVCATKAMKFLKYSDFTDAKKIPKYEDVETKLVERADVISDSSVVIFVSYVWFQNLSGDVSCGPDDEENTLFELIKEAVQTIIENMASILILDNFLWIDYSCVNYSEKRTIDLDEIMDVCDCIVTPLLNTNKEFFQIKQSFYTLSPNSTNKCWIGSNSSYLMRTWCRLELFYSISVPLHQKKTKNENFKDILLDYSSRGKRPHFLFGRDEAAVSHLLLLPSISPALFDEFHPMKGINSVKTDSFLLQQLTTMLKDYLNQLIIGYDGEIAKGKKNGFGKLRYADGSVYEGQWELDHRQGSGKFTFSSGDWYEGNFLNDCYNGLGEFRYKNGNSYEGMFESNLFHGTGKFTFSNGDIYEGDYQKGKRHGNGKFSYRNGSYYEGTFENDVKHGKGVYNYSSKARYEGQFSDDHRHGIGKYFYENGDCYEGEFAKGLFHGKGKYISANGDIYEGEYQQNVKHGNGRISYKNGMVLERAFEDGHVKGSTEDKTKNVNSSGPEVSKTASDTSQNANNKNNSTSSASNPPKSSLCVIS
jgi:hypothetical protein